MMIIVYTRRTTYLPINMFTHTHARTQTERERERERDREREMHVHHQPIQWS